ncbi:MAG: hypothetical protein ACLFUO_03675 [Candidatus Woesearchaeota archaeon]
MEEKLLKKTSTITALLGIIFLFIILKTETIEESTPFKKENDEPIRIKGVVEKIDDYGTLQVIKLSYNETINLVIFENRTKVKEGIVVEVTGKIAQKDDQKTIIPETIKLI